jgi:hypothetical protein
VTESFLTRKEALRKDLGEAHSRISISFDAWTAPSGKAILGAVAHFVNKAGKRRSAVLALRQLQGAHTGENLAGVLLQIFSEYDIQKKIGFFIADNADNNDVCVDILFQELFPSMTANQRKKRRLRCAGHIINLCAHAFLMGKDAEKIAKEMDTALREGDLKKVGELWRKRGALGKLHNVIKYIRGSPQRRGFFKGLAIGGELAEFDGLEVSARFTMPALTAFLPKSSAEPQLTNHSIKSLFRTMPHVGTLSSMRSHEPLMSGSGFRCSARSTCLLGGPK